MSVRIALVDDKRLIRNSLAGQIAYYKEITVVFQANDGGEFLQKMKALAPEERPQVVLMDIEMPVMDGIEAVTIAKEIYPDVFFLMLTVFDNDEKLFEAIRAGATGYLLKDEKVSGIVKAITEIVFEGGVPMSPPIARKVLGLLRNPREDAAAVDDEGKETQMLSARELEILSCIVDGLNYQQIGERLFISPHTVRKHIANIYEKLHVSNKASAIKIAIKKKWFS